MYEVWFVSVDHEGLPIRKLTRVMETPSYDDAVAKASTYRGAPDYALDITRNGRYVSWRNEA